MKVIDQDKSETHGKHRKTMPDGRLLHCCCICNTVSFWSAEWLYYGSYKDLEDGTPVAKFCSTICSVRGGHNAEKVTDEMKQKAQDREYRDPIIHYREATDKEKYNKALEIQVDP